jgi:hypothetical protein
MSIKLHRNLITVEHSIGVRLNPAIFKGLFEVHSVTIEKRSYDDAFPEPGEEQQSISYDRNMQTVPCTSKGTPDKRQKPSSCYSGNYSYVFAHALVKCLDAEQQAVFGDYYRETGIRLNVKMERMIDRGASQDMIDAVQAEVASEFDANVEAAKSLIEQNGR